MKTPLHEIQEDKGFIKYARKCPNCKHVWETTRDEHIYLRLYNGFEGLHLAIAEQGYGLPRIYRELSA